VDRTANALPFVVVGIFITLMVGLRYEVGGDWAPYVRMFDRAEALSLGQQLDLGDPGYQLLNWTVQRGGGGLWLVNTICAAIFAWGLLQLCRVQRDPWLTLLVSIPYCVVVVSIGYTRQATAMGLLMAGLASVLAGRAGTVRFGLYVLAAALFHKTAIVLFPLVALALPRNRLINLLIVGALTFILYSTFLSSHVDLLVRNYIDARYSSQGAAVRVAQTVLPALVFLLFRRRLGFEGVEDRLWRNFSLAALLMLGLLLSLPSSTVVDRISLYLLPLQFVVLARIPGALVSVGLGRLLLTAYLALTLYVWLNYAVHASDWLPYQTWLQAD
jgi:hypothetical protein